MRQVDTAPTAAAGNDQRPHAIVMALTGGMWPADLSTATPWPFWTTSTVIASGTTSSTIACSDHCGTWTTGAAIQRVAAGPGAKRPDSATATAPTISAPMIGGIHRPSHGHALSSDEDNHHRRRDQHVLAQGAHEVDAEPQEDPGNHGHHDRHRNGCHRAADPSGQSQDQNQRRGDEECAHHLGPAEMPERLSDQDGAGDRPEERQRLPIQPAGEHGEYPVEEEAPKIHEASSAWESPPCVPTARITATGPVAAKINPISPLAA